VTRAPLRRNVHIVIRAVLVVLIGFVLAAIGAETARACSCAYVPPKEQLARSDGAVTARLLRVEPIDDGDDVISSVDPTDFVFRTGRVLKGKPQLGRGRRLVVRSARLDASCGLSSDVGDLTGLFLTRSQGRWISGSCSEIPAGQMRRLGRRIDSRATGRTGCT
jgi:hypothetical protein